MTSPAASRPRVALIGVSGYARVHLQMLRELQDRARLDLAAVVVINPEQEAEAVADLRAHGARIYRAYEELMRHEAGAIDLCVIPTGIQWHARMTIAALRAGMNVLVEKPLAGSLDDVRLIREVEQAANRFVAVGFQDTYAPRAGWLKSQLHAGPLGAPRSVRVIGLWPRPSAYYERNKWAGRLAADGAVVRDSPLNNALAHFAHLALFLAAPGARESARVTVTAAELLRAHAIESFDTAVVRGRSEAGTEFWFGFAHACREHRDPELLIECEHGRVEWLHQRHFTVTDGNGRAEKHALFDNAASRRAMMAAVLTRLHDPAAFVANTAMAEAHTALIETLHCNFPIRTIPRAWVEPHTLAGHGRVPAVRGLERALGEAFKRGAMLGEVGFAVESASSS